MALTATPRKSAPDPAGAMQAHSHSTPWDGSLQDFETPMTPLPMGRGTRAGSYWTANPGENAAANSSCGHSAGFHPQLWPLPELAVIWPVMGRLHHVNISAGTIRSQGGLPS